MEERDFEELVSSAIAEFASSNEIPIDIKTLVEKGFSTDAGLIIKIGAYEFLVAISQTVFGEDDQTVHQVGGG